jgi:flagellar protein FliO/FliZ
MPEPAAPKPRLRPSPVLIGTGILVISLGFGLPQLTPSASPTTPKAATADVGNPKVAPAAPVPTPASAPTPAAPEFGTAVVRLIGGLVVVCVLCVVATRYLNRRPKEATGTMRVLASLRVAPRCVVHLVRAGERRLLIGTDATGVKSLLELPGLEPATPQAADDATPEAAGATSVVVGPVTVAVPPSQNDVLAILAKIQAARVGPSSPG